MTRATVRIGDLQPGAWFSTGLTHRVGQVEEKRGIAPGVPVLFVLWHIEGDLWAREQRLLHPDVLVEPQLPEDQDQ